MVRFARALIIAGLIAAPSAVFANDVYLPQAGGNLPASALSSVSSLLTQVRATTASAQRMLAAPLTSLANLQSGPSNLSSPAGTGGNLAEIVQSGKNNSATVAQTGYSNVAMVVQQGSGNTAIVSQSRR